MLVTIFAVLVHLPFELSAPIGDEGENIDSPPVGRGDYHYYSFSTKNDAIVTCSS